MGHSVVLLLTLLAIYLASVETDRHNSSEGEGGLTRVRGLALIPLDAWLEPERALLLPSGFHHHCALRHCPRTVSSPHWLLSVCGDLQVKSSLCSDIYRRQHLSVPGPAHDPRLPQARGDSVHCRSGSLLCPALPSSPPACWFLDLHYGLVEFLTILRWKPGARAPLVYKT